MNDRPDNASSSRRGEGDPLQHLLQLAGPRVAVEGRRRERVRQNVRAVWHGSVRARSRTRWLVIGGSLAAAAALVVVVTINRPATAPPADLVAARLLQATGSVWQSAGGSRVQLTPGETIIAGARIETTGGGAAAFALEGGGELRLQSGSSLQFAGARHVALDRGVIYVDSNPSSSSQSMIVETAAGVVRDIGTRFEVRVDGFSVRVRVRDGAVRLERGGRSYEASAGRELRADRSAVKVVSTATYGPDWNWIAQAAPFQVEGVRLARFLRWAEREGGREIRFSDPSVEKRARDTVLHGSIAGLTVDEALSVVLPTCGLTHRIEDARVIIDAARLR